MREFTAWIAAIVASAAVAFAAISWPFFALARSTAGATPTPPNILVVILDDVGWLDFEDAQTPNLDALAASGVTFDRCWAEPLCSAARAAFLSGEHPFRTGVGSIIGQPGAVGLPVAPSLPATLPGYDSGFFGKWHVSLPTDPLDSAVAMGFSFASGTWGNIVDYFAWPKFEADAGGGYDLGTTTNYATLDQRQECRRWITQRAVEPWFAVLSFTAAHAPFHDPPTAAPTGGGRAQFLAMVADADAELGQVVAELPPNTVVIVLGDNGTPFAVKSPKLKTKAKGWTYEAGIRTKLVVAGPGFPAGVVRQDLVSVVDLHDTVQELAGAPQDGADSESLVALARFGVPLVGAHPEIGPYRFAETFKPDGSNHRVATSDGDWKLIDADGARELYRISVDPFERFDEYGNPSYAADQAELEAALFALTGQ